MKLQERTLPILSDAPKKLAHQTMLREHLDIQTHLTTTITSVRIATPAAPRAEPLTLVSRAQSRMASKPN
jgi:hypothetical protein